MVKNAVSLKKSTGRNFSWRICRFNRKYNVLSVEAVMYAM